MKNIPIGTHIKKARELRELTREMLAEKLGVATTTITRWENGSREPSFSYVAALSDNLNLPISYFAGEGPPQIEYQDRNNPQKESKLLESIQNLQSQLSEFSKAGNSEISDILEALETADEYDLRSIRNILDLPIPDAKSKAN